MELNTRYHLYYVRLDIDSGRVYTIEGNRVASPINRAQAEQCKIWDTGYRLTNMPAILNDPTGRPYFLMPVSDDDSPWHCRFHFIRRHRGRWLKTVVTKANGIWDGCLLQRSETGELLAYLVTGDQDGQTLSYGGGTIEEWRSGDEGASWEKSRYLIPEPGLIYNNPKPIERPTGATLDGFVAFYGWQGPGSIQVQADSLLKDSPYHTELHDAPTGNRGKAYLWRDGEWL